MEAQIQSSVFNLFVNIKTITLLCSVKACRLCQKSNICLHLAVFCSHFFYLTFSLTKTSSKKREKDHLLSARLFHTCVIWFLCFSHRCESLHLLHSGFFPCKRQKKKGKLKMKLQNQGNFNSFKSYHFKKNIQLVDSAYTPGGRQQDRKISRMKIIPVGKQGRDQVSFLPPSLFSLCGFGGHLL